MSAPTVLSDRLILRPVEIDDHGALARIRSDERVGRFTGGTRDAQNVWFTMLRSSGLWQLLSYGYWTLCERASGAVVGEIGFADFRRGLEPDISGMPEAGWIIAPEAWGKGYASEAVMAAHNWLDSARPGRSTCIISPENLASIRIAEKCGYRLATQTMMGDDPINIYDRVSPGYGEKG